MSKKINFNNLNYNSFDQKTYIIDLFCINKQKYKQSRFQTLNFCFYFGVSETILSKIFYDD